MAAGTTETAWWRKTRGLMLICLVMWSGLSFGVHLFADALNGIVVFGFPLGFYMAAQGSLILFLILLFWFAAAQNRIDEAHGLAEDK